MGAAESTGVVLLLIVAPLALLWLLVAVHRDRLGFAALSVRGALVLAFLVFELLVLVITEVASIGHHYTAGVTAVAWGIVTVALLVADRRPLLAFASGLGHHGPGRLRIRASLRVLSIEDCIWLGVLVALFGILVAVGSRYLPSNADSLVYHLARVEHWIQNRTISPFATHYLPQVGFAPLDEYNLALVHLLTGTDRFDVGVALTAAVISVVGVTELARLLGASRSVQIVAAVVCATIPSGVLLATSTENDYFAAAIGIGLLVVAAAFSLGAGWPARAVALGVAVGLGYMTKATIPLMLGPAAVVLVGVAVYRLRNSVDPEALLRRVLALLAVGGVAALVVVGPFTAQNAELFGSPFGPASSTAASSPFSFQAGAANVTRSMANNFHIGNGHSGPEYYVSRVALEALSDAFNLFHVAQDNPNYSVTPAYRAFTVKDYSSTQKTETLSANPWQVILVVVSLVVLAVAVRRGARRLWIVLLLGLGLSCGYLLFTFIAKWGIWDSRYALPLLVAWSAVIAVALSRFSVWVSRVVLVLLVVARLPQLLDNTTRPLVPSRSYDASYDASYLEPYFAACCRKTAGKVAPAYESVTAALAQSTCRQAAIDNSIEFEYPLWVGLKHDGWTGVLTDDDVHNQTTKLESSVRPCATIRQVGPHYRTPKNGTVTLQYQNLALSIDPREATSVTTPLAGFSSSVNGIRVYPGGGWNLATRDHDRMTTGSGTLYLSSDASHQVQLQLHLATTSQPAVVVTDSSGTVVPSARTGDSVLATLTLHTGINRVTVARTVGDREAGQPLVLTAITVGSSGH
jgi:hypothetical protein